MLHETSITNCDSRLTQLQDAFPKVLRSQSLYYVGSKPIRDHFHLGIVGSRRPSPESREILEALISKLAGLPIRVISGGALGVDAQAHACALRHSLPTYSWVVGDPSSASPHTNRPLFERIASTQGSAIITPKCLYRFKNVGLQTHFWLERNAWIAANSDLLLVIQAKERSGTWSTVKICQDLGVSTYAITGSPIDPCYSGNNLMITMNYALPLPHIQEFTEDLKAHVKEFFRKSEKSYRDLG